MNRSSRGLRGGKRAVGRFERRIERCVEKRVEKRAGAPWLCVLLLICASFLPACGEKKEDGYQRPGRVLVIGVDGASPRVIRELASEGRLPILKMLAQEGAFGPLRASLPISSPRIWNQIVTGKKPDKHGILDFAKKDPRTGELHLFSSLDRRVPALWSILSAEGMSVGIVNFWNTYPLEKVNGVMVSDHLLAKAIDDRERLTGAVKSPSGAVIHPEEWNDRLAKLVRDDTSSVPDVEDPFADGKDLPRWVLREELQRRFAEDGVLARIAQEISRETRPDLLMVLLPGVDRVQHYIWGVLEPEEAYPPGLKPTPEGREGGRRALFAYYEYVDRMIGELLEGYGPNDLIMVVSDHGFEAGQALMRLSGVHESEKAIHGIFIARGPGIEPGTKARDLSVNDITPTILTWLGLPYGIDMNGEPAPFLQVESTMIPTYDGLTIEFTDSDEVPSGVESDIVEQLKSLGYIDEE